MKKASDDIVGYASLEKPSKKEEPENISYAELGGRLWRPMVVVLAYWLMQFERSDLTGAFLRTRVTCPQPVPGPRGCPKGSLLQGGACEAVPAFSAEWSGSAHCADQFKVIAETTALGGRFGTLAGFCGLIAQVVVGSLLVDSWGRRPVMLMGLLGNLMLSVLVFIAAISGPGAFLPILFPGVALSALTNAFPTAAMAMASDLTGGSVVQRGLGYTGLFVMQNVGVCIAFIVGFFILSWNLTDYTKIWFIMAVLYLGVAIMGYLLLRETIEDQGLLSSGKQKVQPQTVSKSVEAATKIITRDVFLRRSFGIHFVRTIAVSGAMQIASGYAISVVGLTQSVASLAGVISPIALILGSSWATWFLKRFGPWTAFFVGEFIIPLGHCALGLAAHSPQHAPSFYWLGWILQGFGAGMAASSHMAFISVRVPDKGEHGKLFAAYGVMGTVAGMFGTLIWTHLIFTRERLESGHAGAAYFITAVVALVCTTGYFLLYLTIVLPESLQRRDEPPETTAA